MGKPLKVAPKTFRVEVTLKEVDENGMDRYVFLAVSSTKIEDGYLVLRSENSISTSEITFLLEAVEVCLHSNSS